MTTKNPYLDEFRQIQRGRREDRFMLRNELALKYAWAVPNEDVLRLMKDFAKGYVEIGAGTGYWASLLLSMNIKVDAYDDNSWKMSDPGKLWSPVHAGGPEMAAKHPKSALLLVWPPYKSSMGADAIAAYLKAGGQRLVYVGEGWGGCTGSDEMFELLGEFQHAGLADIASDGVSSRHGLHRRQVHLRPLLPRLDVRGHAGIDLLGDLDRAADVPPRHRSRAVGVDSGLPRLRPELPHQPRLVRSLRQGHLPRHARGVSSPLSHRAHLHLERRVGPLGGG